MQRQTIKANYLQTIDWFDNKIVDWASAGTFYSPDGEVRQTQKYHFGFGDTSITSQDGQYVFLSLRLGTKGLLLKNGRIMREINRSYYCADVYEYPAAFISINGKTCLVHCPKEYCRLDFEDAETGEIITEAPGRDPDDFFHSRLEPSPDGKYFVSKGWIWHPVDDIRLFDIQACVGNPALLDKGKYIPDVSTEICSGSFIDNSRILVCSSKEEPMNEGKDEPIPPEHIAVWDFKHDTISKAVRVKGGFGNIFVIDEEFCWDMFDHPKIISCLTGEIVDINEEISSGRQSSSIIHHLENLPKIVFNRLTRQIAVAAGNQIEILTK